MVSVFRGPDQSGITTTGATVLAKLDELPVSINVWRTFLQWLGGMGILVLAVAILPLLGVGGSQLFCCSQAWRPAPGPPGVVSRWFGCSSS